MIPDARTLAMIASEAGEDAEIVRLAYERPHAVRGSTRARIAAAAREWEADLPLGWGADQ